ncbi:Nucleotidyltransferase [Thozetella sp. PMI_491]|nr:Nucleotidyltransferase [Thozetella sp. PMI_491]
MSLDFPLIFLLQANLDAETMAELEAQIPTLTYDANEAEIFLGRITQKKRALMELRKSGILDTEEVGPKSQQDPSSPRAKRRRLSSSAPTRDPDSESQDDGREKGRLLSSTGQGLGDTIKVVKLAWFTDSIKAGVVLPTEDFLIYEARKVTRSSVEQAEQHHSTSQEIMKRAMADARSSQVLPLKRHQAQASSPAPSLPQETTVEHDTDAELPPIPEYLHTTYACQRPTPVNCPNHGFVEELKKIRVVRTLKGDEIGVRSYSTMISALAAYPYTLSSAKEVARLPGCGQKSATLYREFRETGRLKEVTEADADPKISALKAFYDIYGVGESTAREFYNNGWRNIDDVVEHGWQTLSRVQQIGVKYYDDFQLRIPRSEVENIAGTVLEHAKRIDEGYKMTIVGGYRRGKEESGDVDVVLSHPDEAATHNFIDRIVQSLEAACFLKHILSQTSANTERRQMPVSWKGNVRGSGFDTLDKALVVWQNPRWSTGEAKNPNPHRRVDIIISPWKTVGCAVLGWSSGTTFQRDLRRYCKRERGLKFDSSGIRSRTDGTWVDLESGPDRQPAPDMLTAERRVFAGLGLEYRAPEERCTG